MRTICLKCDKVRETNKELIAKWKAADIFVDIEPTAIDYLKTFNISSGKCIDNEDHQFVFHEDDIRQWESAIKTNEDHEGQKQAKRLEQDKVKETLNQLKQQLEKFEQRDSELPKEIENIDKELENDIQKIEDITGSRDLKFFGERLEVKRWQTESIKMLEEKEPQHPSVSELWQSEEKEQPATDEEPTPTTPKEQPKDIERENYIGNDKENSQQTIDDAIKTFPIEKEEPKQEDRKKTDKNTEIKSIKDIDINTPKSSVLSIEGEIKNLYDKIPPNIYQKGKIEDVTGEITFTRFKFEQNGKEMKFENTIPDLKIGRKYIFRNVKFSKYTNKNGEEIPTVFLYEKSKVELVE